MNQSLKEQAYRYHLNGYTDQEIGNKLNLERSTITKALKSLRGTLEHRLSNVAIYEFEQYFIKFKDAMEIDLKEISEEMGKELDPDRKIKLRDQRHIRRKDLYMLLGDGEMVLVLKKMKKDGITQNSTQTS